MAALPFCVWAVLDIPMGAAGIHEWLPEGRIERQRYEEFIAHFGNDQIVLASWDGCSIEDTRLAAFKQEILAIDREPKSFVSVESAADYLDRMTSPPLNLSQNESNRRLENVVLGSDGTACLTIRISNDGVANQDETIEKIFTAADSVKGLDRNSIHMAGTLYESFAVDQAAQGTLKRLVIPSGILGFIITCICLRSLRKSIAVLFLAGLGQIFAVGMVYYSGDRFSAVMIVLPTLVFMLTLSGAVHLVNYFQFYLERYSVEQSSIMAVRKGWLPCALSSVTTIIGMGSLAVSQLAPVRHFGIYCAFGLSIATVFLLFSFPAAIEFFYSIFSRLFNAFGYSSITSSKQADSDSPLANLQHLDAGPLAIPRSVQSYVAFLSSRSSIITAIGVFSLIVTAGGLTYLKASNRYSEMFPDDSKINRDMAWIENHIGPLSNVEVLVQFSDLGQFSTLDQVLFVKRLSDLLESKPQVGGVFSTATFLPRLIEGSSLSATARRGALRKMIDSSIGEIENEHLLYTTDTSRTWRLMVRVSAIQGENYGELTTIVSDACNQELKNLPNHDSVSLQYTGLSPVMHETQMTLLSDLGSSFAMAFVLITPVMMWVCRSIVGGVVLMLPNVLPVAFAFGMMGWFSYDLDIAGILTASIAMGIAIDDTLHFIMQYRDNIVSGRGRIESISETLRTCAQAMLFTTMISCVSMAPFLLADFIPTRQFATLMIVMLTVAIIGDLVLLPAILLSPLGSLFESRSKR